LTWKIKGTKFNRLLFQLRPKTHRTAGIDAGLLLPTPKAMEAPSASWENRKPNSKFKPGLTLTDLKVWGMLPTPTAMDQTNATATMKSTQVKEGSMHSVTLNRAMAMGMLPTPNAFDWNTARKPETFEKAKQRHKEKGVNLQNPLKQMAANIQNNNGTTSQLNPRFVAEMMGFPPNWTELPFQSGETSQSKDMEMP
jgi:hypothetical protein